MTYILVISFNPHSKPLSRYYYPHLTDMDTEAHRGRLAQSRGVDHSRPWFKSQNSKDYSFILYTIMTSWCFVLFCFVLFWLCYAASRISVPQPGIKPVPPAVKARSPDHGTAREFP